MRTVRPDPADRHELDRHLRRFAVLGVVLLPPTALGSWFLVLASPRGSRCLTYGEGCGAVPGAVLWALFWAVAVLGLAAAVWPRTRWTYARCGAVVLQWAALWALALSIVGGGA